MNPYETFARQIGRTRLLAWLGPRLFTRFDLYARRTGMPDSTSGTNFPLVYLTTTRRRSGEPRTVPLLGIPADDGGTVVAGTNWGGPQDPGWVHNLRVDPHAVLERAGETIDVTARPVEGPDYDRYWSQFVDMFPGYASYRTRTDRPFALFVLEEP